MSNAEQMARLWMKSTPQERFTFLTLIGARVGGGDYRIVYPNALPDPIEPHSIEPPDHKSTKGTGWAGG